MGNHKKLAVKVSDNIMYAQAHGYPMGKTGSPNIKLESQSHRIHFRD